MTMRLPRWALVLLPLLIGTAGHAAPQSFDLGSYTPPPAENRSGKPLICTVTYLVDDIAANQTYAARMQFTPGPDAMMTPDGRMSCPAMTPPSVAQAALEACRGHAAKPADCVFADMQSGFEQDPTLAKTTDDTSRCQSDQASQIAIACWNTGKTAVCNVGCGADPRDAIAAAQQRCQAQHQHACTVTGSVTVQAP